MAARYGNVDVVRYLCSIQANPDLADRVRAVTSSYQNESQVLVLYQKCIFLRLPLHLQEQETPLHCAAWHGYSAVAQALCQAGCHVDAKNREGESPLLTASARGFVDIVECLVEHRANVEANDKVMNTSADGCKTFFWHNTIFVRLLIWHVIKCCVCVVCLFQDGHTALHLAVRRCQVEVVRCLLRHHCHVDQQDRHGNTPLHIACKDGNLPIVMAICSANASLDLPNKVSTTNSH